MADKLAETIAALGDELGPLLAIDTSGLTASLCCVGFGGAPVRELELDASAQPSEALAKTLADVCTESGFAWRALKGIVVGIGPGSFTGLRVGLALAKGLALGIGTPLYGTSSLAMLAASSGAGLVATAVAARRGEIFGALYQVDDGGHATALIDDCATEPESFAALVHRREPGPQVRWVGSAVGDLVAAGYVASAQQVPCPLRVGVGIVHVATRLRAGDADNLAEIVPRYLKLSEPERHAQVS